jgi:hypothetical protein
MICDGMFPIQRMRNIWPVMGLIVALDTEGGFQRVLRDQDSGGVPCGMDGNTTSDCCGDADGVVRGKEPDRSWKLEPLIMGGSVSPRPLRPTYVEGKLLFNHPPPNVVPKSV